MADDLRLYFFECGSLKTELQYIKMNQGLGDPYEVPVPFFLIQHPKGNVLYDGGNALEVAQDARKHWGAVVDAYEPVMSEDDFVVNQLQRLDIDPASVKYVVQSHLHLDHSGAVGHFPNAQYLVSAASSSTPTRRTGSRPRPTSGRTSTARSRCRGSIWTAPTTTATTCSATAPSARCSHRGMRPATPR